ncbi:hypothetical protein PanWU01x14_020060, partial [Parasponia andersonii]
MKLRAQHQQVQAAIKGNKLQDFINSSQSPPMKLLPSSNGVPGQTNPDFLNWEQQDQLLVSWLLLFMSKLLQLMSTNPCFDPYSVEDTESLLLAQEVWMNKHGRTTQSNSYNNNFKNNRGGFNQGQSSFSPGGFQSRGTGAPQSFPNGGQYGREVHSCRSNFNNRGCDGGKQGWNSNKPQCQLCGKFGHVVLQYLYRFDQSFDGFLSSPAAHFTSTSNPMAAMLATQETVTDQNRYLDSRATNHVTPDPTNLKTKSEFLGLDKVHIGNVA